MDKITEGIISSLAKLIGDRDPKSDFDFLNNHHAPNSWTILDKKTQKVWKVIKPSTKATQNHLLEKQALDSFPTKGNIVKYETTGEIQIEGTSKKCPYFVFPFISDAIPLDQEIYKRRRSKKNFSEKEIEDIAKHLSLAIQVMCKAGVVHQDVKPGNILLKNDGSVMIIDLGISRFINEDLKLIKSMKGPYAYLSPERLDMIADLSDSNKRRVGFPSDLFSVGMILFELATLTRMVDKFQPGEIKNAYKNLDNFGLSKPMVELIEGFIDESIVRRQEFVSKRYGLEWFSRSSLPKSEYWIQHSSNGFKFIKNFLEGYKFKSTFGVIFAADQFQGDESASENMKFVKSKGGKVAIDPAVCRLQYDEEHHGYLIEKPYGARISANMFILPSLKHKGEAFINEVINYQKLFEPDFYISPNFVIERVVDKWLDISFSAFDYSKNLLSGKSDKPLYFGITLSERILGSDSEIENILSQLLLNQNIENIYLRVESNRAGSEPNENLQLLSNLRYLIETLSKSKNIFLAFADLCVFGLVSEGLSGFGINPDYEKRKSVIVERYNKPKVVIKIKKNTIRPRYFSQVLWNDILAEVELKNAVALSNGSEKILACSCRYCFTEGRDNRLDKEANRYHFILNTDNLLEEMNSKSGQERAEIFKGKMKKAREAYKTLEDKCKLKFDSSTDGSFIDIWEKVFN